MSAGSILSLPSPALIAISHMLIELTKLWFVASLINGLAADGSCGLSVRNHSRMCVSSRSRITRGLRIRQVGRQAVGHQSLRRSQGCLSADRVGVLPPETP